MMTKRRFRRVLLVSAASLGAVAVTVSCGSGSGAGSGAGSAADAVRVTDVWAKATDTGPTAVFGTLSNDSGDTVTLTAVRTAAARAELHEMASDGSGTMSMREKEGGFEIPAHGGRNLAPGGEHVMLFDLTAPLHAGDTLPLTLTFSDGSSTEIDASVRDFAGAKEAYSEHDGE